MHTRGDQGRTRRQAEQLGTLFIATLRQRLRQPRQAQCLARQWTGLLYAPALHRWQQTTGLVADQQQNGIAGRFFQAFQQGVGGIQVHRFGWLDQHHLAPCELRGLHHEVDQLAYLVDLDRLVRLFRLQDVIVRVGTRS
ncbi:hypothetical protein D9M68_717430 [compost metagenome]